MITLFEYSYVVVVVVVVVVVKIVVHPMDEVSYYYR
jgi:hypothetical protein